MMEAYEVKYGEKGQASLDCPLASMLWVLLVAIAMVSLGGCRDGIKLPPDEQVRAFNNTEPIRPTVDLDRLVKAKMPLGPYRVHAGDVLQLTLPVMLYPDQPLLQGVVGGDVEHTCRVDDTGTITLPDGVQIAAADKTLSQIESLVVDAYYPSLVKAKPAVYARVLEYRTYRVQVLGAVVTPGVYELRKDQLSLVSLLMEAGGVVETGAATIRIVSANGASDEAVETQEERSLSAKIRPASWEGGMSQPRRVPFGRPGAAVRDASQIRLRFEPEGTLRTTGWLTIGRDDGILAHQWLDLASTFQRRMILDQAAHHAPEVPRISLEQKLSRLAMSLETQAFPQIGVQSAASHSDGDWSQTNKGDFVTSLAEGLRDHGIERTASRGKVLPVAYEDAMLEGYQSDNGQEVSMVLPVRGLNIPFADVPLAEGDAVVVERLESKYVTVLGLVQRPGNFEYPAESHYNLAQAIGFAGGLDLVADPRYVYVYRPRSDGTVANAVFQLVNPKNQEKLTEQLALPVRPGDVVSVEQTLRTRTNVFLDRIFRINLGLYLRPEAMWGED